MPVLLSAQPRPELRPFVRAYALRKFETSDLPTVMQVPAQLEQVLNFELGVMPGVRHRELSVSSPVWIGGAQTVCPGYMELWPGVLSFAIFFQPAGWSQLFGAPMREITNRVYDATAVLGHRARTLWNQVGEATSFEGRIAIMERFLLQQLAHALPEDDITSATAYLFRVHGAVRVSELARRDRLGLRQFERRFQMQTGMSPKAFARVARFQAALDAKLASPGRTWLEIAHSFGYHDQMHMIHDFEGLGRYAPTHLIAQIGDVRPPALASAL